MALPATSTGGSTQIPAYLARRPDPPPLPKPAPAAEVPAETTKLRDATATLRDNFDKIVEGRSGLDKLFSDPNTLSKSDLERIVQNPDPNVPKELRDAAQFLLGSDTSQHFLDLGAGDGTVDGAISRNDLDAALRDIDSGVYYDKLLDTAAGKGGSIFSSARDGNISQDDINAALADPGVPAELKDTLRLALNGPDGTNGASDIFKSMSADGYKAASALYNSPEFAALPASDRALIAETFHDSSGDARTSNELKTLISDPSFKALSPELQSSKLNQYNLTHSTEFKSLAGADQSRITAALADPAADPSLAAEVKTLISDGNFTRLSGDEKTAVLSQVRNYPNSKAVHNIDRLIGKDWFKDYDFGDKQRSLKLIAYMSYPRAGVDQNILGNTVEKFLGSNAPYDLKIEPISAPPGNITFGNASGHTMRINEDLITADNGKLENDPKGSAYATSLAVDTIPHEINHLVNGDKVASTFDYLNEEYRGWYVGYSASHGHPPSNQDALERWSYFLSPGSGYYDSAAKGALADPGEAAKIYDELSKLTGLSVDASNCKTVLTDLANDTSKYKTDPNAPALVPPGNVDNH